MSYYDAFQINLKRPSSHGFQMDVNYTYSDSIDMGSDTERDTEFTGEASFSDILNTWKPYLNRGHSDFDTRQLSTGEAVYALPFGRGKTVLSNANRVTDALVGGWQLSGINRWSSGLPFSLTEPGWSTNWQIESFGVTVGPVPMHRHFVAGNPQFFANPDAINNDIATGGLNPAGASGPAGNIRLPYPGEAGQRNNFRGDGYFDVDSGLTKSWKFGEVGALKFAWETYNTTNTVRFDPSSIGSGLTGGNLGVATRLLTAPRRMQFSLRYDF